MAELENSRTVCANVLTPGLHCAAREAQLHPVTEKVDTKRSTLREKRGLAGRTVGSEAMAVV